MNIIQIQDRLKGVDDQALVGYVENPTGEVPTYLALGELGRREEMRAKYQAQAQPTQTVAEEIVAKVAPQMGIGALTNNMAAPQMPQPEVMSESEAISETGIANLPAPNVGNYAGGGIVGYAGGGGLVSFTDEETDEYVLDPLTGLPQIVEKTDEQEVRQADPVNVSPNEYLPYAPEVGSVFGMPKEPNLEDYKTDLVDEQKAFGMDPEYFKKEREAIRAERGDIQRQEDTALNTALIRAGLGMAAGKSQFALSNVAEGAQLGLEGYVKDIADIKKEQKLYDKEERALRGMERAEQKGDAAGYKAYKKETIATQLELIKIDGDLKAKALANRISASTKDAKAINDAFDIALKEMKLYWGEDALTTRFRTNPQDADKEQLERVNRILGPQGITPKFNTVEPKGGLGGENQKPKPKPEKQTDPVTDPVKVTTIEEVEALTAGTSYITPSGIINTR
jgi:hypothetical protein